MSMRFRRMKLDVELIKVGSEADFMVYSSRKGKSGWKARRKEMQDAKDTEDQESFVFLRFPFGAGSRGVRL